MELRKSEVKRKMRKGDNMMNAGIYEEEERKTQRMTMYGESISERVFQDGRSVGLIDGTTMNSSPKAPSFFVQLFMTR